MNGHTKIQAFLDTLLLMTTDFLEIVVLLSMFKNRISVRLPETFYSFEFWRLFRSFEFLFETRDEFIP